MPFPFGNSSSAPVTPAPAPAPVQSAPPVQSPQAPVAGGQPIPGVTSPAAPLPTAAPQTPTIPENSGAVDLNSLFLAQAQATDDASREQNDQQMAAALAQSLVQGNRGVDINANGGPPVLREDAVANMIQGADFVSDLDLTELNEAFQNNGDIGEPLKAVLGNVIGRTISTMVPLLNQLSAELHKTSIEDSMSSNNLASRSQQIVSAFNSTYAYHKNPVVSSLLPQLADSLAKNAPPNTDVNALAKSVHGMFSNMSLQNGNERQPQVNSGHQTDFDNLF